MKILAIDSSAVTAGCAVMEDDRILAESFVHTGLTHSETLLPMIARTLSGAGLTPADIDCCAVSSGPGSFTGIRIGVAVVKGIAFPANLPCIGVSTPEAIAWGCLGTDGTICAVMDARRHQVYNALFTFDNGQLVRLCEDRAIAIGDLTEELRGSDAPVTLAGDGAQLCYDSMRHALPDIRLAPPHLRYQRGFGVGMAARRMAAEGAATDPEALVPTYLRPSQAERTLKSKNKGETSS